MIIDNDLPDGVLPNVGNHSRNLKRKIQCKDDMDFDAYNGKDNFRSVRVFSYHGQRPFYSKYG